MRLVVQIGADDRRVARVARGQHRPIADPAAFGIGQLMLAKTAKISYDIVIEDEAQAGAAT